MQYSNTTYNGKYFLGPQKNGGGRASAFSLATAVICISGSGLHSMNASCFSHLMSDEKEECLLSDEIT